MKNFSSDWLETFKAVMFTPKKFFSKISIKKGYAKPLKFVLTNVWLFAAIASLFTFLSNEIPMPYGPFFAFLILFVGTFVVYAILFLLSIFIGGVITHLCMKLVGGRGRYKQTVFVLSYATAVLIPLSLCSIPSEIVVGITAVAVGLYDLYLTVVGLSEVHKVGKGRTLLGVLLPAIAIIAITIVIFFIAAVIVGMMEVPGVGAYFESSEVII